MLSLSFNLNTIRASRAEDFSVHNRCWDRQHLSVIETYFYVSKQMFSKSRSFNSLNVFCFCDNCTNDLFVYCVGFEIVSSIGKNLDLAKTSRPRIMRIYSVCSGFRGTVSEESFLRKPSCIQRALARAPNTVRAILHDHLFSLLGRVKLKLETDSF